MVRVDPVWAIPNGGGPPRHDSSGGVYRATGCVEPLARCPRIARRGSPNLSRDIPRGDPKDGEISGLGANSMFS